MDALGSTRVTRSAGGDVTGSEPSTWKSVDARAQLLSLFTLAAGQPALETEFRRKLASALN